MVTYGDRHIVADLFIDWFHHCYGNLPISKALRDHSAIGVGFILDLFDLDRIFDGLSEGFVGAILGLDSDALGLVLLSNQFKFLIFPGDIFLLFFLFCSTDLGDVFETFFSRDGFALGGSEGPVFDLLFDATIGDLYVLAVPLDFDRAIKVGILVTFTIPNGVTFLLILHATILAFHPATLLSHFAWAYIGIWSTKTRIRIVKVVVGTREAWIWIEVEVWTGKARVAGVIIGPREDRGPGLLHHILIVVGSAIDWTRCWSNGTHAILRISLCCCLGLGFSFRLGSRNDKDECREKKLLEKEKLKST